MIRSRWTGALLVAALLATAATAAAVTTTRTAGPAIHRARSGFTMRAATVASAAATAQHGVRMVRREVTGSIDPGAVDGSSLTCPRKYHATSGYWGTDEDRDGDLVVVRSTPVRAGDRHWEVAMKNVSLAPITAYVGVVCVR